MESVTEILGPTAGVENKVRVEWPEKGQLFLERDKYVEDNIEEAVKEVRGYYPNESGEAVAIVARMMTEAVFMMNKVREISPLPVGVETKIIKIVGENEVEASQPTRSEKNQNWETIGMTYEIHLDEFLGQAKDFVGEDVDIEELDAYAMSGAVHEFAHILYNWEAVKGSRSKQHGVNVPIIGGMFGWLSDDKDNRYFGEEKEVRARLWELKFLKKYYPESVQIEIINEQLEKGKRELNNVRDREKKWKKAREENLEI